MSLPHMILGVLKYGPVSGYDLNKAFQASVQHFWNTEQSQIYRSLYKMFESGWVRVEHVVQEIVPDKKVYHLTEAGHEELKRWLATPQPLPAFHEGWLGQVFFGAELSTETLEKVLRARFEAEEALIKRYQDEVAVGAIQYAEHYQAPDDLKYWMLTLDYGIKRAEFDLKWAQSALALIKTFQSESKK
jgi:PadR family transcriptional regulator, regulatory protein AphA